MKFFPKATNFSALFEELADNIERSGRLLMEMLRNDDQADVYASRLNCVENEADAVTHTIYRSLHQTFITPLDREDMYTLVNKMDNIVDMIETSSVRMNLYKLRTPVEGLEELVRVLNEAIGVVKRMIYDMKERKQNHQIILDSCKVIDDLETEGDRILRHSMQRLFEQYTDAIELIKRKDILERVEATINTCKDVSSVIEGMILKYG